MIQSQAITSRAHHRKATVQDAGALRDFGQLLLKETALYARLPRERAMNDADMAAIIASHLANPRALLLNLWDQDHIIGEAVLTPGQLERTRHCGIIGIGILQDHWHQGYGQQLMQAVETHARQQHFTRLELTVFAHNQRAHAFYHHQGYHDEGCKKASICIQGEYYDEIIMAKFLSPIDAGPRSGYPSLAIPPS